MLSLIPSPPPPPLLPLPLLPLLLPLPLLSSPLLTSSPPLLQVMDLLRYWHCAGGANTAVTAYSQALASLEISGASPQELVAHMKRVALFYHKLGASDSARQLLVGWPNLVTLLNVSFSGGCVVIITTA